MKALKLYLGALLLVLPGVALADKITPGGGADTWTFYGYANAYVISRILEAINRITSQASFVTLTTCIALVGFLVSGVSGLLGGKPQKLASYMAGIIFAVYALFGLKVDIYVEDMMHVDGLPQHDFYVSDVSAAVGLPAVVISEIGMWATRTIETQFSSPSGANPPRLSGGAMFGQSAGILRDISQARLSDPELRASIQSYIADCAIPAIHTGKVDARELTHGDVWQALSGAMHKVRHTKLYGSAVEIEGVDVTKGIVSCELAYTTLSTALANYGPALLSGTNNSPFAFQKAVGDATLTSAVNFVSAGHTSDATALATQAAMIEVAQDGYKQAAIATDSNSLVMALNTEQARRAQKTGWFTASMLFQDMAGYFFAILQAFVIGLAPIVLAALLVPNMGMKIASGYSKVMVWLMLWWPGLAIVNYIMSLYMQNQVSGPLGAGDGLTMANIGLVNVAAENMVIASGFMATLVPGIMWGLVSGSGAAFASVLDRASGAMYASQAARETASGNASMGNISMNNSAMNAHQMSHRYSSGFEAIQSHLGASSVARNQHLSGDETTVGNQAQTINRTEALSKAHTEAVSTTAEAKEQYQQQWSSKVSDIVSDMRQHAEEHGYMDGGKIDWSRASLDSEMQTYQKRLAAADRHAEQAGLTEEERQEEYDKQKLQGGFNPSFFGIGFGVSGEAGQGDSQVEAESRTKTHGTETAREESQTNTDGRTETAGTTQSGTQGGSRGERTQEVQAYLDSEEFSELNSTAQTWSEARQHRDELAKAKTLSETTNLISGMSAAEWKAQMEDFNQEQQRIEEKLKERKDGLYDESDRKGQVEGAIEGSKGTVGDGGSGRAPIDEESDEVVTEAEGRVQDNTAAGQESDVGMGELEKAQAIDKLNNQRLGAQGHIIEKGLEDGVITEDEFNRMGLESFEYAGETYTPHTLRKKSEHDVNDPAFFGKEDSSEVRSDEYSTVYRVERADGHVDYRVFADAGQDGKPIPLSVNSDYLSDEKGGSYIQIQQEVYGNGVDELQSQTPLPPSSNRWGSGRD